MIQVYCANNGKYIDATGGETLEQILARVTPPLPFRPICARVNNKTEGLTYAVFGPKQVEYLSAINPSGGRVYVRSLCMMLYKAVSECFPGVGLRMEHSISRGYYGTLQGDIRVTPQVVATLKERMAEIAERDLPFVRHENLTEKVRALFAAQGLDSKVKLLDSTHELYTVYYELDGLYDSYYGELAPSTGHLKVFDLQPYREGVLLLPPRQGDILTPEVPIEQAKMYRAFTEHLEFNEIIGVKNVGELNEAVEHGHTSDLINVAEALHDKKIARISDDITRRYRQGGARIVLIAGPSSSGKTTTTKRLAIQLMTNLLQPRIISLDDYFVDRVDTPRDTDGDYDYESLYALNLERFNSDLNTLLHGGEVTLPRYNFALGKSENTGPRISLGPNTILLIEGIHGLNPELTAHIDEQMKYRLYVSALTTLSIDDHNWVPTTDNRLLRRIVRDHRFRKVSATDTLRRWPSVRRGEEKWIFPYQENADAMFNSSLLFELGVIKELGEDLLKRVPQDIPQYAEAYRLRRFLSYFAPIDASNVPTTSVLREFLGGSSFHY